MDKLVSSTFLGLIGLLLLSACTGAVQTVRLENEGEAAGVVNPAREFEIVTLLPRDAIPAIDNPVFLSPEEADSEYNDKEFVMGLSINGDHRAYSVGLLSGHEIVNDTVGGRKIAVTW
jgi:hypothetical protein